MGKHMDLEARSFIASSLTLGVSLSRIAEELGVSVSTVSREIKTHRALFHKSCYGRTLNNCALSAICTKTALCSNNPSCVTRHCSSCGKCNSFCPDFVRVVCPKLSKSPYVCNGCKDLRHCRWDKYLYVPATADKEYRTLLSECRSGFNMNESEFETVDRLVSPLILSGLSPYDILVNNRGVLECSKNTLYRLVNSGVLSARKIDLPRAMRFKPRRAKPQPLKVDRSCRTGRTYNDYLSFREAHPDIAFSQMDSVEGKRGGSVLLTIVIERIDFMFVFVRRHNNSQSVTDIFNQLYSLLPRKIYTSLFGCLLTDNGSEFSNPTAVEFVPDTALRRSFLFYCNPSAPYEKPKVENTHTLLRRILPKGSSLDNLSQADVNIVLSHVNSYSRRVFNGLSPAQLFVQMYGAETLQMFGQSLIPPNEIVMKPTLLQR